MEPISLGTTAYESELPFGIRLFIIQIDICTKYSDMVSEAGLSGTWAESNWPQPSCTWQNDRGLGYHIQVFWELILICVRDYSLQFQIPL